MTKKKNDLILLKIEDMGDGGEGIGKYEGFTFFVKGAVIGDTVEARIMKLKKSYGYARLMKVVEPSEYRREPGCVHAGRCGGCQLQAMDYEAQLAYKAKKIQERLIRIGGLAHTPVPEIMGMEDPWR